MEFLVKNAVGRPRMFSSPEEFSAKCDDYFAACRAADEPYLITGLCLFLGFSSRNELADYAKYQGYADVVATARMMVEQGYEKRLQEAKPTGAIFALKNMGWRDERHVDVKSSDGSMSPKPTVILDTSKLTTEQLGALYGAITVKTDDPVVS